MSEVYKRYTSGRDIFHPWQQHLGISNLVRDFTDLWHALIFRSAI
jgi:hypothetical protein